MSKVTIDSDVFEFILNHVDWCEASSDKNITEAVIETLKQDLDWEELSTNEVLIDMPHVLKKYNESIDFDMLLEHLGEVDVSFLLSISEYIDWEWVSESAIISPEAAHIVFDKIRWGVAKYETMSPYDSELLIALFNNKKLKKSLSQDMISKLRKDRCKHQEHCTSVYSLLDVGCFSCNLFELNVPFSRFIRSLTNTYVFIVYDPAKEKV